MPASLMPAAFIGHGSPTNALEQNRHTNGWRAWGASMPKPAAILAISAHWYINATAVTAMAHPRTIHDFYGFSDELFAFEYPAPGAPEVAQQVADVVNPTWVGIDHDSWGLDHGTWSVLAHAFPQADIPVVQLSINGNEPFDYHVQLGAALAPLLESGVLIVGSGNVVHNLRLVDWSQPDGGEAWAQRFDDAAVELITSEPGDIARLVEHPDFATAAPTPDHFMPLLFLGGLAAASGAPVTVFDQGCVLGSLSMTSFDLRS